MNNVPVISIVIPLYNKGKYIARALDSVFAQTFEDYEVIVVDDGSTDNGPDVVRQYADLRLRLIKQANAGPGAARNRGIKESNAKYVAFLDSDDEWLPNFLAVSCLHLKQNTNCALTTVGFYFNEVSGQKVNQFEYGCWRLPQRIDPINLKRELNIISVGTVLCRKVILKRYSGFYENGCFYGEDSFLWLKVILNHTIFRDPEPLFIYHIEASGLALFAKKSFYPPQPYLSVPKSIREMCPSNYYSVLEKFLSYWALKTYHRCLGLGEGDLCKNFIHEFPEMKKWKRDYLKLKIKLLFPWYHKLYG